MFHCENYLLFSRGNVIPNIIYMGGSLRRTSISLHEDILKAGQRLAKNRRRNFSNYVADLIAADAEKAAFGIVFSNSDRASTPDGEGKIEI